jgi:hypothetical protein
MDSIEDYARHCAKHDKANIYTLSEWVKSVVRQLIQIKINKINGSKSTRGS